MTTTQTPTASPRPARQEFPLAGPTSRAVVPTARRIPAAGPAHAPLELPDSVGDAYACE